MIFSEKIASTITLVQATLKSYLTAVIVVIISVVSYQGLRIYNNYLKTHVSKAEADNIIFKAEIEKITKEYDKLKFVKDETHIKNVNLEKDLAYWKDVASKTPRPPVTPKPPVEESVLVSDLKAAGVEFRPLSGTMFSTENKSLPIIWTWNKDSLRVPGLELKLDNTEIALGKSGVVITGLKEEIGLDNKLLVDCDNREAIRKQQEENFNKQIVLMKKEMKVEKVKTYMKIGAAVVVGYFGGKAVSK